MAELVDVEYRLHADVVAESRGPALVPRDHHGVPGVVVAALVGMSLRAHEHQVRRVAGCGGAREPRIDVGGRLVELCGPKAGAPAARLGQRATEGREWSLAPSVRRLVQVDVVLPIEG